MKLFLALALLGAATASLDYEGHFVNFVQEHDKNYETAEMFHRFKVFSANMDIIEAHNKGNHSFTMGINKFADLTSAEFAASMNGYKASTTPLEGRTYHVAPAGFTPNDAVDWRTKGAVTPVKDQGDCVSSWAFSATGAIEGAVVVGGGALKSVSEQELVDCAGSSGNHGCQGGLMDYAFTWVAEHGIEGALDYVYTAQNGQCKQSHYQPVSRVTGYNGVRGETDLLSAVAQQPVSIAIETDQSSFQMYHSGVFSGPCGTKLDHGVLAVGYGTDSASGKDYWIVKNSWGTSWGDQGYIRIERGQNLCGIGNAASYPTGATPLN